MASKDKVAPAGEGGAPEGTEERIAEAVLSMKAAGRASAAKAVTDAAAKQRLEAEYLPLVERTVATRWPGKYPVSVKVEALRSDLMRVAVVVPGGSGEHATTESFEVYYGMDPDEMTNAVSENLLRIWRETGEAGDGAGAKGERADTAKDRGRPSFSPPGGAGFADPAAVPDPREIDGELIAIRDDGRAMGFAEFSDDGGEARALEMFDVRRFPDLLRYVPSAEGGLVLGRARKRSDGRLDLLPVSEGEKEAVARAVARFEAGIAPGEGDHPAGGGSAPLAAPRGGTADNRDRLISRLALLERESLGPLREKRAAREIERVVEALAEDPPNHKVAEARAARAGKLLNVSKDYLRTPAAMKFALRSPEGILPSFPPDSVPADHIPWGSERDRIFALPYEDVRVTWTYAQELSDSVRTSVARFLHTAASGRGAIFIDAAGDGVPLARSFLKTAGLSKPVTELSIHPEDVLKDLPGYNLLAREGEGGEKGADTIAEGLAAAATYARDHGVAHLANDIARGVKEAGGIKHLTDEGHPSVMNMLSLFCDEDKSRAVASRISDDAVRRAWVPTNPETDREALDTLRRLLEGVKKNPRAWQMLGAARDDLDLPSRIARGETVMVRLTGKGDDADRLIFSLLTYDLFSSTSSPRALSRKNPEFHIWINGGLRRRFPALTELAQSGLNAALNGGMRLHLSGPHPMATRELLVNSSAHMLSALPPAEAYLVSEEWGGYPHPEVLMDVEPSRFISRVARRGITSAPFGCGGLSPSMMFPPDTPAN